MELRPWSAGEATERIRKKAKDESLKLDWTKHAKQRMAERDLIIGDVLHLLKHGFVQPEVERSTQPGFFKYRMDATTPNSGSRVVRVVVIPSMEGCWLKIITVMWRDEA